MDIIQCRFCNKPFQSIGGKICNSCLDMIDEEFVKIRDHMYDNPNENDIDAVCEATGVQKNVVLYLIKEKRVTIAVPGSDNVIRSCTVCGKPIAKDSMCDSCRNKLSDVLEAHIKPDPKKEIGNSSVSKSGAMHVRRD